MLFRSNWASMSKIGESLMSVTWALMKFGGASLFIPTSSIQNLVGALLPLAMVMVPLGNALSLGGAGMTAMAAGVLSLSENLKNLDLENLNKIKEVSQAMANMASSSAVVETMSKLASAINGKGASGNGASDNQRPVEVVVKLNGLEIARGIQKSVDRVAP